MAYQLSLALHLPLDVLIAPRKIGAPGNAEYALGAVSGTERCVDGNQEALSGLSVRSENSAVQAQAKEVISPDVWPCTARGGPFPNLKDRTVILVDATGWQPAPPFASSHHRATGTSSPIMGAIPVGLTAQYRAGSAKPGRSTGDPSNPEPFYAIRQFLPGFEQVEDRGCCGVRPGRRSVWTSVTCGVRRTSAHRKERDSPQ